MPSPTRLAQNLASNAAVKQAGGFIAAPSVTQATTPSVGTGMSATGGVPTATGQSNVVGGAIANGMITQNGINPISSTALNVANPTGVDFNVPKTSTVPSTALVGGTTVNDLLKRRSELEQGVINANTPSQMEQDLTQELNTTRQLSRKAQLALSRETEKLQTQTGVTQDVSNNFISDTARRYARTIGDLGVGASGLADQLNAEISKRTANVSAAEGLLKADKENISLLQDLQKMSQPNVIGSPNINQFTGEVSIFEQDPMTGQITTKKIGNIGATKDYIQSGTYQDNSGNQVFWGRTANGTIETKNLGGGGNGSGTGYTPSQQKAITALNEAVAKNDTYQKTNSMRGYAQNVSASLAMANGVSDIAAINQFQKVIDEGAVTRDQDVKLIQSASSFVGKLSLMVDKLRNGEQLTTEQRTQMNDLVQKLYSAQIDALLKDPYIKAKTKEAELYNLSSGDTILGELGGFTSTTPDTSNQPQQFTLPDGSIVTLQADGTYK